MWRKPLSFFFWYYPWFIITINPKKIISAQCTCLFLCFNKLAHLVICFFVYLTSYINRRINGIIFLYSIIEWWTNTNYFFLRKRVIYYRKKNSNNNIMWMDAISLSLLSFFFSLFWFEENIDIELNDDDGDDDKSCTDVSNCVSI